MAENITFEQIAQFKEDYLKDPKNAASEHAVRNVGIDASAKNFEAVRRHNFVFSNETPKGEITNQKKSGRCWYFAALNSLKYITMRKLNVEKFEFSETHLYFYDKLEKANTYLEEVIATADKDLDEDRATSIIVRQGGAYDGGYWEYFKPLALKYGLVPKSVAPETFNSEKSSSFIRQLDMRLRKTAMDIRSARRDDGASVDELREMKNKCLSQVYNICVKALGHPVEEFEFTYKDKDGNYHNAGTFTPVEFMEKFVGREEIGSRVVICSDPREIYPYGRVLNAKTSRSVYEAEPAGGLNLPMPVLRDCVYMSIKEGRPVWFACDVSEQSDREAGILDTELYDYDNVLTELGEFSKKDRFASGFSSANHAMNIVGMDLDEDERPKTWKVENSWGKDNGKDGIFSMSHEWFMENTYEAIVDMRYVPKEYRDGFDKDPIELEPWDLLAKSLIL